MFHRWALALLLIATGIHADKDKSVEPLNDKNLTTTTVKSTTTTEPRIAIDYINVGNFNDQKRDPTPISPGKNVTSQAVRSPLGDSFSAINMITSGSNGITIDDMFVDFDSLCEGGSPYSIGGILSYCTNKDLSQCPEGFWCHMGSSKLTTYCCPGQHGDNGCTQELNVGYGGGQMSRWYFDRSTRRCLQFRYRGYGGNENNFLTSRDCDSACGSGSESQQRQPAQQTTTPQPLHPCLYEGGKVGSGSYRITRWSYDWMKGRCYTYEWSGTGGTPNSFGSQSECEGRCGVGFVPTTTAGYVVTPLTARPTYPPFVTSAPSVQRVQQSTANPCNLQYDQGFGTALTQRWFYNGASGQCLQFNYLGSGGNANNFPTPNACQDACGTTLRVDPSVCSLPQMIGSGSYMIPRWSFNPATGQCSQFIYSGCCGNDNRFSTAEQCLQACRILQPPVIPIIQPTPQPIFPPVTPFPQQPVQPQQPQAYPCAGTQQPAGSIQFCSANTGYQCNAGFYCHVGGSTTTTLCCPLISNDPCSQPQVIGTGSDLLPRWFYNANIQRCDSFVYRGLQGNQNNFLTYDQCTSACLTNPCGAGTPYTLNGQSVQCSFLQQNLCPNNYYCHIGSDTITTTCCPRTGESRCNLPVIRGNGNSALQRWTFNPQSRKCEQFVYSGRGGNENNFLTEQDCLGGCPVADNPCLNDVPLTYPGSNNLVYCSTSNLAVCQQGYYCHIGAGAAATVCCKLSAQNPCALPLTTGTGNAILARWYFDAATSTCKAFTYTGLKGNENNFLTLADCRRTCPEYENPCPQGTPPFNQVTGQVAFCTVTSPSCPSNYWCHLGASRQTSVCCPFPGNPCTQTRAMGTGNAQLPRYYYDSNLRICAQFTYTGKGGNQNNFVSKSDCEAGCPVLDNPCQGGMPAITGSGNPLLCSTANTDLCPPTYWCHIGFSAATTLCCPGAGDPCRMALSAGSGTSVLNRWYYNTDTKTCLSYTYSGRGGNQNNFISLAECRLRCPEYQNPCSTGQPHIGLNGQITHCGATTPSICPTTYWCHIGSTLDTSVCCPGAGNPCDLPLAIGNGNANLLRYYYDRASQSCRQFQYTGMGGNENVFQTQQDCEKRCPVFRNPCSTGDPVRSLQGQVIPCSVSSLDSCPNTYWCHIGSDEQSTLCCPGATNPCREPLQLGTGGAALPRHYYNSLTQQCLPFTYSGTGGSQNNFLSRADCERTCPVFANPCAGGDPATGPNGQYTLCTATNPNICPANYWCHIGDINQNSICCPGADNPCQLGVATGNGNGAVPRWYFDRNVRRCTRFTYTGLGGNQNNFLTLSDCQLRCPEFQNPCANGDPAQGPLGGILFCSATASTCPANYWCHVGGDTDSTVCCPGASDPCMQSMQPGIGSVKLPRWYFNQNTRQCLEFTYTGRSGNQNNFLSENECVRRCPVFQNPCTSTMLPPQIVYCSAQSQNVCPAGYWCHVGRTTETSVCCGGAADPCALTVAMGTGAAVSPLNRWYFDGSERRCKQFSYSGLGGNQNNFLTQQDCQQKCPEFVNPCLNGSPYQESVTGLVRYCSRNSPTDCPANFWCHFGANTQSTVCCPGTGDACTLPQAIGSGPASLPRWYFNAARQCQQFSYTGISGNQNNFLTQRDCQQSCPEFSNPCGEGTPLTSLTGQITYCSPSNPFICPVNYFCHFGVGQETTLCCPTRGDPCNLPRTIGTGSSSLQRYFFNSLTRKCEGFVYTGTGGNANNFLQLDTCRARCPEFNNPCVGQPYSSAGGQTLFCNSGSVCPPNYFCHYGQDTTTTLCCPASGDPCALPVIIGPGGAQLTRYYYNSVTRSCVSFVYSGLAGNENNFRTQAECQARCQPLANPCSPGQQPFQDPNGRNLQCGTATGLLTAVCPTTYYCHIGADVFNTVCCPITANNRCELNPVEGTGDAILQRWYFNRFASRCQLFTYRGLAGNANNFLTESECIQSCVAQTQLAVAGSCPQGEPLSTVTGAAQQCNFTMPTCPSMYVCNMGGSAGSICCPDPRYFCLQPRFGGNSQCVGTPVIRYGYDPNSDTCVPFQYTGCQGNLNNFVTNQQCTNICCNKGYNRGGKQLKQADSPTSSSDGKQLRDSALSTTNANVTHVLHSITTTTQSAKSSQAKSRIARWLSWLW